MSDMQIRLLTGRSIQDVRVDCFSPEELAQHFRRANNHLDTAKRVAE